MDIRDLYAKVEELEELSQQLRNLYRILVNGIELEPMQDQQKANCLYNNLQDISFSFRTTSSINGNMEILPTILKDNRLMTIPEIAEQTKKSRHSIMCLFDNISHQFSKRNVSLLVQCNLNESRKRNADLEKSMEILI